MANIIVSIPNQIPRRYPVPESFTYRELNRIKQVTGLRPAEFEDALNTGDPDIVIALALICAGRAGHNMTESDLLDLDVGSISVEGDDEPDPTVAAVAAEPIQTTILEAGGTQLSPVSTESDHGNSPS